MRIIEKIKAKADNNSNMPAVTIGFIGDSVTQGCFEVYNKLNGAIETVFDKNNAYHAYLAKIMSILYPTVPVNIINAGVSGGKAPHGLSRLDRDIISHAPDLAVVCFGLNDCFAGIDNIHQYTDALDGIFSKLKNANIETIFMTPNMMCTDLSCHLKEQNHIDVALTAAKLENSGVLEQYLNAGKEIAKKHNIKICDCYSKWKTLHENGVNITDMLSNNINHPTRDMNYLFAISLIETMMS